jgi:hypothetical protein
VVKVQQYEPTPDPLTVPNFGPLEPRDEVTIRGEHGKFRYLSTKLHEDGTPRWVNLVGPITNPRFRSVTPSRVVVPGPRVLAKQREGREK